MKIRNFNNYPKSSFVISLLAVSIVALGLFASNSYALHPAGSDSVIKTLVPGFNQIAIRDSSNTAKQTDADGNSISTVTLDTSTAGSGFVTITVTDVDANLDPTGFDVVLSSATSTTSNLIDPSAKATTELTETGIDTGTFSGIILLSSSITTGNTLQIGGGDISVFYDPEPLGVGRLSANLNGVVGNGDVELSDFLIDTPDKDFINTCPYDAITHPVNIDLPAGVTANDIDLTLSFANVELGTNENNPLINPGIFEVVYRTDSTANFESLNRATELDPLAFGRPEINLAGKTIINTFQPSSGTIEGQYAVATRPGCVGGGGGGLVRPGLVVNALAGIGSVFGGGGGGGPPGPTLTLGALALHDSASEIISLPQEIRDAINNYDSYTILGSIVDIYEDFDLPLSINGNGFALGGYENTIETQTIEAAEPTEFVIVYYTNSEIAHTSLYFNLGPTRTIAGSDTQVLLYKDKPVEIIDPNGNIASATGSINNEGDLKRVVTFSITFSENIQWSNSDLVIRAWNDNLNSGDTIIYDAIEIAQSEIVEIADEDLPEPEIQTLKSQYVPIWIKNNAAWWSQELIEDSDFIAGIEYLIQQEIITLTDTGTLETNSYDEIPNWIKNNAGWWSEDLITEKEFIDGLQWLIGNGIIQVTET